MNRLVARRGSRVEPIGYWMRIGDAIATGMLDAHEIRFRFALHGEIPDGLLFRVSSLGLPPDQAEAVQGRFIRDLLAAIDPHFLPVFVGGPVHDAG
jgi:EpsI family protein